MKDKIRCEDCKYYMDMRKFMGGQWCLAYKNIRPIKKICFKKKNK